MIEDEELNTELLELAKKLEKDSDRNKNLLVSVLLAALGAYFNNTIDKLSTIVNFFVLEEISNNEIKN